MTIQYAEPGGGHITQSGSLNANQLDGTWQEIPLLQFNKSANGPIDPIDPDTYVIMNTSVPPSGHPLRTSTSPSTVYDVKIEWSGYVDCLLDYIVFENFASSELHNGNLINQITGGVDPYIGYPALLYYKLWDEPKDENFLPVRYAKKLVQNHLNTYGHPEKNTLVYNAGRWPQKFLAQTQMDIQRCDVYPLFSIVPIPGSTNYLNSFQDTLNHQLIPFLRDDIPASNKFGVPFWFTPQADSWSDVNNHDNDLREPSAYEIKVMTNLGIAYGAKGIQYFMFSKPTQYDYPYTPIGEGFLDDDDPDYPVKREYDDYNNRKWDIIKDLNAKIAAQGNMLMSLTWNSSYYIHDTLPSGKYITNVQSYFIPQGQNPINYEPVSYTQLSLFDNTTPAPDQNKERFFVINRRTLPDDQRTIVITYNKTSTNPNNLQNWTIREVGTNNYWSGSKTGSFQTGYDPAEGKLFTLEPTVLNGGDLVVNETISGTNTLVGSMNIKSGKTLTISGTYNVQANITVESGGALVVQAGSIINLQNGSRILVTEGQFVASSLTTSITINCSSTINGYASISISGSGSQLKNVIINNGNGIECLVGANITIMNCTLNNCINGIDIYNSQPQIIGNIINNPQQNGIYGGASGLSPLIQGNTITRTTDLHNFQGIYLGNSTLSTVINNTITGFYFGCYFGGGCVTQTGNTYYQCNNTITGNADGLTTAWGSTTIAGRSNHNGCSNAIYGNILYDAYSYQYSNLSSYYDYWGGNFLADGTSSNNIQWRLSTNPCNNLNQSTSNNDLTSNSLYKSTPDDLHIGLDLENAGKIDDAIDFYKNLIKNDNYVYFALTNLVSIKNKYSKPEIIDYFENILDSHNKHYGKVKKLIGDMYLQNNRFDYAITAYNDVITNSPTDYDGINARFEKLFAYLHVKEDPTTASQILSEIKGIKSEDAEVQIRIKIAENLIYGTNKVMKKNVNTAEVNIPKTYELFQNYPNPFNPETIIKYQIPKPGLVTLKVYDILGREVATLINENKIEGFYDFSFNASRFTSGVYIYQLRANDYVSSKKMILLK